MIEHDCEKLGKNRIFVVTKDNDVSHIPYGVWVLETVQCAYLQEISYCPYCGFKLTEVKKEVK